MLERRRTLAAALAALAFPVSGALPVAPSAAAPDLCLRTVSPEAPPVCAIPPMPPPRREVRPPPPAWTPSLALVARSLAMEWPSLGLGPRELEMVTRAVGCGGLATELSTALEQLVSQ